MYDPNRENFNIIAEIRNADIAFGYFALGLAVKAYSYHHSVWYHDSVDVDTLLLANYNFLQTSCIEPDENLAKKLLAYSRFPFGSEYFGVNAKKQLSQDWHVEWEDDLEKNPPNLKDGDDLFNLVNWRNK